MSNTKATGLNAPDSERAMFDTINYRAGCRQAEAEARNVRDARDREAKAAASRKRKAAKHAKARRQAAAALVGAWIGAALVCWGIRSLLARGILDGGWGYLLTALAVCAATYATGYVHGRRLL